MQGDDLSRPHPHVSRVGEGALHRRDRDAQLGGQHGDVIVQRRRVTLHAGDERPPRPRAPVGAQRLHGDRELESVGLEREGEARGPGVVVREGVR